MPMRASWTMTELGRRVRIDTGHVLCATAFAAPIIAVFVPVGLPLLLGITSLGFLLAQRVGDGRWPSPPPALTLFFALALLWSGISALWSIDIPATLGKLPRFFAIVIAGLVAIDAVRRMEKDSLLRAGRMLQAGFVVALLLLAAERVMHAPIRLILEPDITLDAALWNSFNRGVSVMALLVWPTALLVWRWSRWAAVLLWAAMLAVIATYSSNAALLAMIAGGAVFVATLIFPRGAPAALAAALAAFILVSPLLFAKVIHRDDITSMRTMLPRSGYHRLLIWNFTAEHIFQRPLAGWGFNTARSIPGGKIRLDDQEVAMPLHPHNGALQIWLELGLPGALLAAALAGGILLVIRNGAGSAPEKAAMTGLSISTFAVVFLSYGVWQSWWMSAIWLCVILAAMSRRQGAGTAPRAGAEQDG